MNAAHARPHRPASFVPLLAAGGAAMAAGALGPAGVGLMLAGAALAVARGRGVRLAIALGRPLAATVLAAVYMPLFVIDFVVSAESDPVLPLARLVAMLAFTEGLAGTRRTPYRPLLLALLLVIVSAAETTDAWFAAALVAVCVSSVLALSQITVTRGADDMPGTVRRLPVAHAAGIACASLVVGGVLFFLVPHAGAGWGRRPILNENDTERATGLSDEVRLGALGLVKARRTIALRGRVLSGSFDGRDAYWRAQVFEEWTGSGWRAARSEGGPNPSALHLRAGRRVTLPNAGPEDGAVVAVKIERAGLDEIVLPGPAHWIEAGERSTIVIDDDGLPRSHLGAGPRRYAVGLSRDTGRAAHAAPARPGTMTPPTDPAVTAWAASVAPGERDALALARAFEADLSTRPYSLDLNGIDPSRPLASFLDGTPAHCEYFATAMALGLRARGVPARAIGGYLGSDRMPFGRELIVRDERAHLWVEAFVPDEGWVRFDPTPPAGRQPASGLTAQLRGALDWGVVAWDSWIVGIDLDDQQNIARDAAAALVALSSRVLANPLAGGRALAAVLAVIALFLGLRGLRRRSGGRPRGTLPKPYRRFLAAAKARGLAPRPAETAREFARRAGRAMNALEDAAAVTSHYEWMRFAASTPAIADAERARRAAARLARARRMAAGR